MPALNETSTLLNATMSNQSQIVNYALSGKLLDKSADLTLVGAVPSQGASGFSLPLILILIFVLASIVGVIVTALFVMRRRFSTWRLDTSKGDVKNNDNVDNGDIEKEAVTAETKPEAAAAEEEAPTVDTKVTNEQQSSEQLSPSSNSPLINEAEKVAADKETEAEQTKEDEEVKAAPTEEQTEEVQKVPEQQVMSSSSLIVNVLNELSESVATKLAGEVNSADPEKEPLKNE